MKCPACSTENTDSSKFCYICGHALSGSRTGKLNADTILEGRYVIVKTLGQGGMGAVYLALDTRLKNMPVAIKEMSTQAVGGDLEAAVAGFQKEAELLVGLKHDALPVIKDFFSRDNRWYLVMDYIEGHTLKEEVQKRGRIPENEVLNWAWQLCEILEYLHKCKPPVIFRDLKADNIMLTPEGKIKLIDFGIARHFQQGGQADTIAYGSSGFAPPEQYGENQTDARSDIYALGATLHFLLTGVDPSIKPFSFELPSKYVKVSMEFEKAIMKALALKIENRPQHISEFRQLLPSSTGKTININNESSTMPLNIGSVPPGTLSGSASTNYDLNKTMPASGMMGMPMPASQANMQNSQAWHTNGSEPRYTEPQPQAKRGGMLWLVVSLLVVAGLALGWYFIAGKDMLTNKQDAAQDTISDVKDDTNQLGTQADTEDSESKAGKVQFDAIENILASSQGGNYSVYIKELDCDKRYGTQNSGEKMTAAGLVFVPILYEALKQIDSGQLDEQSKVTISKGMLVGGTGTLNTSNIGDSYSIRDLMNMMMNHSDNSAANILIDRVGGMSQINRTMRDCGLGSTYVNRRLMDKDAMNRGVDNYTSAEDMGKLLELCLEKHGESYFSKSLPVGMEQVYLANNCSIPHQVGVLSTVYNDAGVIMGADQRTLFVVLSSGTNNAQAQQIVSRIVTNVCSDLHEMAGQ
ncbi:MAG: protein kinase domain-containing protein [Methanobacterium sp.]